MIASASLIILSPLMLLTAVAIKLETGGPIIFRQQRLGFNNQPFAIYKFRTMRVAEDGPAVVQARPGDPRSDVARRIAATDEHRRTAAAVQRAQGRDVDRRPATARACA